MNTVTDKDIDRAFDGILGVANSVEETVTTTRDKRTSALKEVTFGVKFSIPTLYTTVEMTKTVEMLDHTISKEEEDSEISDLKRSVYNDISTQAGNYIKLSKSLQEQLK